MGSEQSGASTAGDPEPRYQIGTVAEMTELSIQTLRHWDEVGLVRPSERSDGGFRLYSDVDVQRLLVIRRMKPLEFTLEEMGRLLDSMDLLAEPGSAENERKAAVEYIGECHRRAKDGHQAFTEASSLCRGVYGDACPTAGPGVEVRSG